MRNLFPVINSRVFLHRQPCGVLAKIPPQAGQSFQPEMYELNGFATTILTLCNGTTPLKDILDELRGLYDSAQDDVVESACKFIIEAVQKRLLQLHDEPCLNPFKASGSSRYYSPSHFAIEVTDACNLKCQHCYRNAEHDGDRMLPTNVLLDILRQMAENGVTSLELTGGEPTFHPDFSRIIDFCSSNFSAVAILTNGWFMDDLLARQLAAARNHVFVQVDLDGDTAETHDRLRGVNGSFDRALRAIDNLVKHGVPVRVAMNVYPGNWTQIFQTFELARSKGANWFAIAPLMSVGRGSSLQQLTVDQFESIGALATELAGRYPEFFFVSKEMERRLNSETYNCGAGSRAMVLGPGGIVRPCLLLPENHYSMGNLAGTSYCEFLKSTRTAYFYELNAPNDTACGNCNSHNFCMGCMVGPVLARENARQQNADFSCRWNEGSRLFEHISQCPD